MGLWQSLAISQSGMGAEQLRAEIAARNIASANVVATPGSPGVKPLRVVVQPQSLSDFSRFLDSPEGLGPRLGGVNARVVEQVDAHPRKVLDPSHPLANSQGYIEYPGINSLEEMFAMTMAVRAYEANVTAFNAARTMATRALEIGGSR